MDRVALRLSSRFNVAVREQERLCALGPLREAIACAVVVALVSGALEAQTAVRQPLPGTTTLHLWPAGTIAPRHNQPPETDITTAKDDLVAGKSVARLANVSEPTLTLYPTTAKPTGAAVVVFPGGGYNILAIDLEGTEVCDWLSSIGITCILVKYRVPDSGPYPKSALALQDAQRALGMVRSRASEWNIDAHRIGVLGFSAGGHLVAALSTHFDQRLYNRVDAADDVSCRPDFAVLVYPAYLVLENQLNTLRPDIQPNERTPPSFMVQTEDDGVHVENAVVYFLALKNAKVPGELHIYARGGHGYGLRMQRELPVTEWPELVERWLRTIKILPTPAR